MPTTSFNIIWNSLNFSEWEQRFGTLRQSNLLQSYTYAKAVCRLNGQKSRWGLIEIDGQEAGMFQIIEAEILRNALHAVVLDRGPLWFEGFGNPLHFNMFVESYNRIFPQRFGRRRRFIPEVESSAEIREILKNHGFKQKNLENYETIWLDLRIGEEDLRQNLKKNWRNSLSKAERSGLKIEWDDRGQNFSWLLNAYSIDKKEKNYDGPSENLLKALAREFVPEKKMIIGRALINSKPLAGILVLCHGSCATYQIGWSSQAGRDRAAHHLLLWDALRVLKGKGINDFDLGGINEKSAAGVKKFKEGMGGKLARLPGIYT